MASRTIRPMSTYEPLRHLIIPGALLPLPDDQPRPALPPLPHLAALLRQLQPAGDIECDDEGPSDPAELATALALGLPAEPGRIPWAAIESGIVGTPCAWIVPCHWQLGMDHVLLTDPVHLHLGEEPSRALLASVAPLLNEDGIEVTYQMPNAWLAKGEVFRELSSWSIARAVGHRLTPALLASTPIASDAALLRRLQSELQMVFYTHPVNEAREQARQLPINALWITGAGMLSEPVAHRPELVIDNRLIMAEQEAAGSSQEQAIASHHKAWEALDADSGKQLLDAFKAGHEVRLILCGPRRALAFAPSPRGLIARISRLFERPKLGEILKQL